LTGDLSCIDEHSGVSASCGGISKSKLIPSHPIWMLVEEAARRSSIPSIWEWAEDQERERRQVHDHMDFLESHRSPDLKK